MALKVGKLFPFLREGPDRFAGAVFDFEEDQPRCPHGAILTPAKLPPSRKQVAPGREAEFELESRLYAKDAPSHRSAWTTIDDEKAALYRSFRRKTGLTDDEADDEADDGSEERGGTSKLATSMPAAVAMRGKQRTTSGLPPMERKTSLSERGGILVPSLLAAMRERDTNQGSRREPSRTEQIMLEGTLRGREGGFLYTPRPETGVDPYTRPSRVRPVLDTVADESERETGQGEENMYSGTAGGMRGFVLPRVPRDDSGNESDVGWKIRVASWASRLEGKKEGETDGKKG